MASVRAHLYETLLRIVIRSRFGRNPDVAGFRRIIDRDAFLPPKDVAFIPAEIGGVPGEWARSHEEPGDAPRLLFVHGGGFIAGSARMYRSITGCFANAGFAVFAPDYRLAPEHPFPAGLEDVIAAWSDVGRDRPAAISGDSAGGNLALGLMIEARRRAIPLPAAAALFSPVTDLFARGASFRENAQRDALYRVEALQCLLPAYRADPSDPRASPIEGDLTGFPPLLIHVAQGEMLRDDSLALAERARKAGVEVDLSVWPVVPHSWQIACGFLPEARTSLAQASTFLRDRVERARARRAA